MGQRTIPAGYEERVYAGVLGKIIGVYLGRPFEGWDYARIMRDGSGTRASGVATREFTMSPR